MRQLSLIFLVHAGLATLTLTAAADQGAQVGGFGYQTEEGGGPTVVPIDCVCSANLSPEDYAELVAGDPRAIHSASYDPDTNTVDVTFDFGFNTIPGHEHAGVFMCEDAGNLETVFSSGNQYPFDCTEPDEDE